MQTQACKRLWLDVPAREQELGRVPMLNGDYNDTCALASADQQKLKTN